MDEVGQIHGRTTTQTTITETHVQTNIRFDPSYIKTIPGALKVVAVILNMVVFICGISSGNYWIQQPVIEWSFFVSMTAFWVTSILIVLYLFHFVEKFHVIPWSLVEMGFCGLWTFFYLSAGIDNAVKANGNIGNTSSLMALSVFAFLVSGVYGFDCYLKYKCWKAGQFVQGERKVQQTQSSAKDVRRA